MKNIRIKEASSDDIPVLLGLLYELGRPKPKNDSDLGDFKNLVKQYIKDQNKQILVATCNDIEIIGMISVMFLFRLNQLNYEMYIPELVVLEKYQKQGIGKKLIEASFDLAKGRKCHRVRLESGNQRKESHQFYKNLGFEQHALSFIMNLD